jgi:endonuclease YncB( thermonuclease family)
MTPLLSTRLFPPASVLALACLSVSPPAESAPPALGWATEGRIVAVHDGDTVTFEVVTRINVRLVDAWCPELDTESGKSAKRYVDAYGKNRPAVLFVPHGKKQLGDSTTMSRVLGTIWVDGEKQSLNELLVQMGYAMRTKEQRDRKWGK